MLFNPIMVVTARESRGMTQRVLAEAAGISPSKLSKCENGILTFSEEDIQRIAEVTGFRPEFFRRKEQVIGLGSSLLFNRKQKTTPIGTQKRVQARINVIRLQIESLLRAAEVESTGLLGRIDIDDYDGDARAVARRVRAALYLPLGPVQSVTAAIEGAGGIVVHCNLDSSQIDGAHLWLPNQPPMFFLNADRPGDRMRFSLAHELGHAVMHAFPDGDIEKQANEFAAEFLMPSEVIRHELQRLTLPRAAQLKPRWKVSMAALIYNAHALGCIPDDRRRMLFAMLREEMQNKTEPIEIPREQPTTVSQLLGLHRKALGYGDDELRSLLMMDDPEFMDLPDGSGPRPATLRITQTPIRIDQYRQNDAPTRRIQ